MPPLPHASIHNPPHCARCQRGAVAIEFAALFALFFAILYGILAYSLPLLLQLSFKQITADAARRTVRVDPALEEGDYLRIVAREAALTVSNSWLPADWVSGNCPAPASGWTALPAEAPYGVLGYYRLVGEQLQDRRYILDICLQRKYNRTGAPNETAILPTLNLLGFDIPSLPTDADSGDVVIRGRTEIRL
ncbi:TadE/TadG family type IV pilus assembly protein [Pseudomonas sp. NW5]|uniref:TadE/TadG family type IV pilus assembly protein n=1 Tax=Pseudomonas sp. NW5 TaxID=2934934 RepID=UPI0020222F6D|nr:TadE/TadG family type IV pilus assembly protein [Pseudomonas sp. NW5]MCL7462308.1 pilus assembly protein [Pseudomonas sp. NW5]